MKDPFGYFNNPWLDRWQTCSAADEGAIPLYEKREWVGLTDEEIDLAIAYCGMEDDWWAETVHFFAATIEAKLKEKNT